MTQRSAALAIAIATVFAAACGPARQSDPKVTSPPPTQVTETTPPAPDTRRPTPPPQPPPTQRLDRPQRGLPTGLVVFESGGTEVPVRVEIAQAPLELQIGLMHRRHLAPGTGMLFLMPTERPQRFWMKNTLIPLDMIFVDGRMRVVGVVANTVPHSLEGRGVNTPSRYVIEVPGGYAAAEGIRVGDRVRFDEGVPKN